MSRKAGKGPPTREKVRVPWVLHSPSQLSVVRGPGPALGWAAGWGWAGEAQVGEGLGRGAARGGGGGWRRWRGRWRGRRRRGRGLQTSPQGWRCMGAACLLTPQLIGTFVEAS